MMAKHLTLANLRECSLVYSSKGEVMETRTGSALHLVSSFQRERWGGMLGLSTYLIIYSGPLSYGIMPCMFRVGGAVSDMLV